MSGMSQSHVTQVTVTQTESTVNHETSVQCRVNISYFKSWQGLLKMVKLVCILACLIAAAVADGRYYCHLDSRLTYGLAISVLTFMTELFWLVLYICSINLRFPPTMKYVILAYHALCVVLYYAAVVAVSDTGCNASAFVAFGVIILATYSLELYFNVVWLKDGPELIALPCITVASGSAHDEEYVAEQQPYASQQPPAY